MVKLLDVSRGRAANDNADRRRVPKLDPRDESLVRRFFDVRRTLWFPKVDVEPCDDWRRT